MKILVDQEEWLRTQDAIDIAEDYLKVSIGIWNDEGVDREVGTTLHRAWDLLAGALSVLQTVQKPQPREAALDAEEGK